MYWETLKKEFIPQLHMRQVHFVSFLISKVGLEIFSLFYLLSFYILFKFLCI